MTISSSMTTSSARAARTLQAASARRRLSAALIFLASDAGSYVTGITLPVEAVC